MSVVDHIESEIFYSRLRILRNLELEKDYYSVLGETEKAEFVNRIEEKFRLRRNIETH